MWQERCAGAAQRGGANAQHLQDEVPVWGELQVQVSVVQMFSEGQQELVLPADVCGEDEGTQLLFYVLPAGQRGQQ